MIMIRRNREGIKKITVRWSTYIYIYKRRVRNVMNEVKKEDDERKEKESQEGSSG